MDFAWTTKSNASKAQKGVWKFFHLIGIHNISFSWRHFMWALLTKLFFYFQFTGYSTNTLTNANVGIGKSSLDSHSHFRQSGKRCLRAEHFWRSKNVWEKGWLVEEKKKRLGKIINKNRSLKRGEQNECEQLKTTFNEYHVTSASSCSIAFLCWSICYRCQCCWSVYLRRYNWRNAKKLFTPTHRRRHHL